MATTLIDYHHQSETCTNVGVRYCMWDHVLVTYDKIERSGSNVTISGLCMKGWWDRGSTYYFSYYGALRYGADLIVNGQTVAHGSAVKNAGGHINAGEILFEQCGLSASFSLPPGENTIQVQVRGTDEFAFTTSGAITVTIPAGIDPPGPPSGSLSCSTMASLDGATGATVRLSGVDFNCPAGNDCSLSTSIKITQGGSTVASTSGRVLSPTNLQPNTHYNATGRVSNGSYSRTSSCSFTTLTSSRAFGYKWRTDQVSQLSVNVDKGGNACSSSTKVSIREKGSGAWKQVFTTTEYGVQTFQIRDIIVRGKQYEAKTETTNCAGTYTSTYNFTPPAADNIIGDITSADSELEDEAGGQQVTVNLCYSVTSALLEPVGEENPITVFVQYRIKGQTEWEDTDPVIMTTPTLSHCITLPHLACSSEYEFRLCMQAKGVKVYSAVRTLATATCADMNSCTCNTLEYMTELICQEVFRIKDGMKTIYANCDSKELCDPYSKNPTWASILSRILRFVQMVVCITCSMDQLKMVQGEDDDIYTATEPGEYGVWEKMVNEALEGEGKLLSSDGAKKAIDYFISSVWHPIGVYDYFAWEMGDLAEEAPEPTDGETAVVGENWYEFKNGAWVDKGRVPSLEPFGTILIKKGTLYANHEYYWFADEWNLLDFAKGPIIEDVERLESKDNMTTNKEPGGLKIQHNLEDFDYSTLPCERTVCFVVEDMVLPPKGSYRVTFPAEPNATIYQYQDVVEGGKAQNPGDPTRTGFTFAGWKNGNTGGTFDWDAPITSDVEVIAQWTPQVVTVTFDINGATGTAPASITAHYGDTLPALPDDTGFSLAGATFHGWARDGVPFTGTTQLVGDTTLVAVWHMSEFDVTFHPENGEADTVVRLSYGSSPAKPADPTKDEYLFTGWFTSPAENTGAPFSFTTLLYGPTDIYARWVKAKYTVTFDSAGGTDVPSQLVNYMTRATMPSPNPTKEGFIFGYWMLDGYRYHFDQEIVANTTLVAKWWGIYTVTFEDTFGDKVWDDQTVVEGNPVDTMGKTEPTRDGYTFAGWFKKSDNTKWNIDTDLVMEDMTLVAVFTKNEETT